MLLEALARQTDVQQLRAVICVNNSTDDSAAIALGWLAVNPVALDLEVIERKFESVEAHVGMARRVAMDRGADLLGSDEGLLVSTDADCRPPPTWIGSVVAAMGEDDDRIIGGQIVLDPDEVLDPQVRCMRARLECYWAMVRAIEDDIDPAPWDAAPRHGDHTGASLAMTVALYRRAGGVPLRSSGEDTALVDAARAAGGRLVHPQTVWTHVSGRAEGRAPGGMAVEMARLADDARAGRPPKVPQLAHWRARVAWRVAMSRNHAVADVVRMERALPPMPCDMVLDEP